jgi:hypothetical protein
MNNMALNFVGVEKIDFSDAHLRDALCTTTFPPIWHKYDENLSLSLSDIFIKSFIYCLPLQKNNVHLFLSGIVA